MQQKRLRIGLFDQGMTHLHRVGLAGLYMTLRNLDVKAYAGIGRWDLAPDSITFYWDNSPKELIDKVVKTAFGISQEGYVSFHAHKTHPIGDIERFQFQKALTLTFLQHPRVCKTAKELRSMSVDLQDKVVSVNIKPVEHYQHQDLSKKLVDSKGDFARSIKLKGWVFPGGAVRHEDHGDATALTSSAHLLLPLAFAPAASLYFLISHHDRDGRFDKSKTAALVLPHITDLASYSEHFSRYLESPVHWLYANSLGDAALSALSILNSKTILRELAIDACSVMAFGSIPWNRQRSRTGFFEIKEVDPNRLNTFSVVLSKLTNQIRFKEDGSFFVATSPSRGLLAENIASGSEWFKGFHQLMASKRLAYLVSREKGGLKEMIDCMVWSHEADKLLVEAVHMALRNRYGMLAQRAKEKGETVNFGREFERIRTSFARTKNAQTMRAGLADLFARGGLNKTLQQNWTEILPLFSGTDWQRARDLALLALASYTGKGAEMIDEELSEQLESSEEEE